MTRFLAAGKKQGSKGQPGPGLEKLRGPEARFSEIVVRSCLEPGAIEIKISNVCTQQIYNWKGAKFQHFLAINTHRPSCKHTTMICGGDWVDHSICSLHADPAAPIIYFSIGSSERITTPWPAPSRHTSKGRKAAQAESR